MHKPVDLTFQDLLKNKPFLLLWANQFCLQMSYSMTNFALILWVYELTKRNTIVSLLILTISIPSILFGTFAGVIADRVNRKHIIQITDVLLALLFFAFWFVGNSIALIFLLAFIISIVSQFFLPAEAATIPTIVPKELLVKANSLFSLTIYASLIVGYSLAGPAISLSGNYITPFVLAGLLTGFASIIFLRFPSLHKKSDLPKSDRKLSLAIALAFEEIREGLHYVINKKIILVSLLLLTAVQAFVSTLSVLIPEYINNILQIPATNASYIIMLPLGLGLITGAFFNGAYAKLFSRRRLVEISIIGVSTMLLLLASAPVISDYLIIHSVSLSLNFRRPLEHIIGLSGLLAIFSYFLGFFNVSIVIPAQTVLQEYTPEALRGRVFGVLNMLMSSLATLPVILVGSLADWFGTVTLISTIALCIMFIGLFIQSKRFVTERLLFRKE
ncbi:MAG: MFS transporter [bacterium]|nr:MFS transporter [bacterium]